MPDPRVLVIGLDGATFDLIEPWSESGHLPNFASLMAEGAWGRMRSTMPANSAPAWSTFATGLEPGRHGIFYFVGPSRDSEYFRPVSSESIHGRTLWDRISAQGRTVGILNVPMTYPPKPVNGYMIAGMLSPNAPAAFWPPELYQQVVQECGDYVFRVQPQQDRHLFLAQLLSGMEYRCRVSEYLLEHHPVDMFAVVFRMIDPIMHRYWPDMDHHHPLHATLGDSALPDAILSGYRLLDEAIGRLLARIGSRTTVLVVSDHGFRAEYRRFAVNKWLRDRGLLVLRPGRSTLLSAAEDWAERLHVEMTLKSLGKQALGRLGGGATFAPILFKSVDWSHTQVVFGPNVGLNINLEGRDFAGIVPVSRYEALRDRLIEDLKGRRDPETGLAPVAEVYRREEIYKGPVANLAPDLVPEPTEYTTNGQRCGFGLAPSLTGGQEFSSPSRRLAAGHAREGIFIARGPGIRSANLADVGIADMAPTILYAMGLPVPKNLDGRVLTAPFDAAYVAAHPIQYEDPEVEAAGKAGRVLPEEDEVALEQRLRGLGYL